MAKQLAPQNEDEEDGEEKVGNEWRKAQQQQAEQQKEEEAEEKQRHLQMQEEVRSSCRARLSQGRSHCFRVNFLSRCLVLRLFVVDAGNRKGQEFSWQPPSSTFCRRCSSARSYFAEIDRW